VPSIPAMARLLISFSAILAVLAALYYSAKSSPEVKPALLRPGRNNTALFISNGEYGLANTVLSTSHSLAKNYPDVEVHYASFPSFRKRVERLSNMIASASEEVEGKFRRPTLQPITFHELQSAPSFADAIKKLGYENIEKIIARPGLEGVQITAKFIQLILIPWEAEEYLRLYNEIMPLIETVDPAVVVLDATFAPAVNAVKSARRKRVIVNPNALAEQFARNQPYGAMLWKYPA
jgi:hypothetical protein